MTNTDEPHPDGPALLGLGITVALLIVVVLTCYAMGWV